MRRALLFVLTCAASVAILAPAAQALTVQIVNQSGQPDSNVFVTLAGNPFSATVLGNNVPTRFSTISGGSGKASLTVNKLVSGRLYVSYGAGVTVSEPFTSSTRFDWAEFTVNPSNSDVANLTAVDQFGIGMRLDTLNASNAILQTLSSANSNTVFDALAAIPGGPGATIRAGGKIVRVMSPTHNSAYPNLKSYVASMSGKTITLHTAFFGAPFTTSKYTGTFKPDGSITLTGTTNPPGQAPATIPVSGAQLVGDIYTGGNTPNNLQGAIYRDVLSGFSAGFWGGKYGDDAIKFCTDAVTTSQGSWCPQSFNKPGFGDARVSQTSYAACEQYAAVINQYSDAYGNPYSDASKPVQIGLNQPGTGGKVATLRLTIPPDTGNAKPVNSGNPKCGAKTGESESPGGEEPPPSGGPTTSGGGSTTPGAEAPPPADGGSGSPADAPPEGAPTAPLITAPFPQGRALLRALNLRRTAVVVRPEAIPAGTAICPSVCGILRLKATVRGGAAAAAGKATVAASEGQRITDGETQKLALSLTVAGRRLLRKSGRLHATLAVTATATDGTKSTAKQPLLLRKRR